MTSIPSTDMYNIYNCDNEIMFIHKDFTTIRVNNKEDIDLSLNYYGGDINFVEANTLKNWYFFPYEDFSIYPLFNSDKINGYGLQHREKLSFNIDLKIPFLGSVYSSYLLNNGNSMKTAISLANEERNLRQGQNVASTALGVFGGALNFGFGFGLSKLTGGLFGGDSMVGGVNQVINSTADGIFNAQINEFNYKKTVSTIEATKEDYKNKVADFKSEYARGGIAESGNIRLNIYALPKQDKIKIFSDIYFNGYVVETYFRFNDYDNRINFNYFELGNVFQLCSQYLKLPKKIMKSISTQLESGVRLWKTNYFNYTLELNNQEISYEAKQ